MAAIAFKQSCPSCEHAIPIRDAALVGKKIECPKCKYRFVLQKPKAGENAEAGDDAAPAPAKSAKPAAAAVKAKAKAGALRHVEEDEAEVVPAKAGSRKKLLIGLVLAAVGVVVLVLASFVILGKPSSPAKKPSPFVNKFAPSRVEDPIEVDKPDPNVTPKKSPPKLVKQNPPKVNVDIVLTAAGPELTNLLPGDTEHVFHGFFKEVFDVLSPFRGPITGDPRGLPDDVFRPRLGFAVADIDDFIRADRFTSNPWTFTVIHLKEPVDEAAITAAFGLKRMPTVRGHEYFKATKSNPWFDQLSHIAVGVPQWLRLVGRDDSRPLCVRFHNPQTIIFAHEAPLQELLKNDMQFPLFTLGFAPPPAPREAGPDGDKDKVAKEDDVKKAIVEKAAEDQAAKAANLRNIRSRSYLTIKPKLKEMLDRLEAKSGETPEKPLFSTATELEPARVPNHQLSPDERGKFLWRGKQIWDLATLLDERKPRLAVAGSALVQRDGRTFQYRAEFECAEEKEARNVLKVANELMAPELARNFERYLNHKIEIPKTDAPNPADVDPMPKKDVSRWEASIREQSVDVRIDLFLDAAALGRLQILTGLFVMAARAEVEVVSDPRGRHLLGQAATDLANKGRTERKIAPGSFPPGTFNNSNAQSRISNLPSQRLSWMTAVLPYLGHGNLYNRIDFAKSWREPANWLPARTIVPEFLDGSYPDSARFVAVAGIGVAPAATHIVGITGVGLDAGDYPRDDPAYADKRGIFGYDRSATLADLQKGRGTANTVMMMQIPHDGLTGVSPWIAGGGSTLRGVPETKSLAPFVLTSDKNGKKIEYKGHPGAYAIMADGSVRFFDASMPDDVFKTLCTVGGSGKKADFFGDDLAPIIPDPAAPKSAPVPKVAQAAKTAPAEASKLEIAPPPTTAPIDDKKK